MPVVLQISDAHKAYGGQVLLDGAELRLTDAMKVALIGRNGAGKSTLCRCILGEEQLDTGTIDIPPETRVAYLQQHDDFGPDETVQAYLERITGQPDWRCGAVAGRFDLKGSSLDQPVATLSGGWQTRVKLSAMLLREPQLLILDEPTNYLDLRTQLLLERFLAAWRGAALIVSHDRAFLGRTCTHTCEVAAGRLNVLAGDVETYYARLAEQRSRLEQENATIEAKRKQLQTFIDKHRAGANTASQARNKSKQLDRLELHQLDDGPGASTRIRVPQVEVRSGPACRCQHLAIGYDGRAIASGIELEIERGSRVVVVGDNGQGKTTFLRTLTGSLPAVAGRARWTHGADLGVYGQHVFGTLPERSTVRGYLQDQAPVGTPIQELLAMAGSFLFRDEAVEKPIGVLSGGERARLVLAGMLLHQHTVLVLDEPTNHLDVETVDALSEAITRYAGTVIAVSHDRNFLQRVATDVVEVRDGGVQTYPGDFATYLYRIEQELAAGDRGEAAPAAGPAPDSEDERAARKTRARLQHQLEKRSTGLERKLAQCEQEIAQAEAELATCSESQRAAKVAAELVELRERLAAAEEAWLDVTSELDELRSADSAGSR